MVSKVKKGQHVVTRLSTTPIKGFSLTHPDSIQIDQNGAVGDRSFFMIDDRHRLVSITKTGAFARWSATFDEGTETLCLDHPDGRHLEDVVRTGGPVVGHFSESRNVPGKIVNGPWSRWLSDLADRPLTLVRASEPGEAFDEYPVTLMSDASATELVSDASSRSLDPRRFRMLIGFEGAHPYEEEKWHHRTLTIGSVILRVGGPVPRCNATTRDPGSGVSDVRTLHLIKSRRGLMPNEWGDGLNLGVYGTVEQTGTIEVGDELRLDD